MRHQFFVKILASAFAVLAVAGSAFGVTVTPQNHAGVLSNAGITTYYWATKSQGAVIASPVLPATSPAPVPSASGCTGQPATVALNGSGAPLILDMSLTLTSAPATRAQNGVLLFNVTNGVPLTTINGGTALGASGQDLSIRVEYNNGGAIVDLPLVDVAGLGYNGPLGQNPHISELAFGNTDPNTVQIGVPIGDFVAGELAAFASRYNNVNQDNNNGLCTSAQSAANDPTTKDSSHFCAPNPAIQPAPIALNIGIVPRGAPLSAPTADATGTTGAFQIVLDDCPPGAAGGGPGTAQNYTVPQFSLSARAGDQQVALTNNTPPLNDVIPISGVLVIADTGSNNFTTGSPVQRPIGGNFGNGGTYNISGLANDTQWCFTIADVNIAGWPTVNPAWDLAFAGPPAIAAGVFASPLNSPAAGQPAQAICATPSQIDGFLSRSTCFIATAAYGEEWDWRLEVLRQFRDQVLEQAAVGRAFVDWYYSWSPEAAHWLLANPSYKAIVRVFLLPLVEGARISLWIRANMWVFGIVLILGTAGALAVGSRRRTT